MSYTAIAEMAISKSLRSRVAAAAASEGIAEPMTWANDHMWQLVASPGWGDKWSYASDNWQVNVNPDFGARTDVMSDADILAAVQALNVSSSSSS